MPLTKNEIARLRKVQVNLHNILDNAHQSLGILYPEGLKDYRDDIQRIIKHTQSLMDRIKLPPTQSKAKPGGGESLELDLDDEPDEAAA